MPEYSTHTRHQEMPVYSTHTRHQPAEQFRHLNFEPKKGKERYSDDKDKNKHLKWTVPEKSVSSSWPNKTRKEGCREDKTSEPVPKKSVSSSSLNKTRKEGCREDKTGEPVPKKCVSSSSLNKTRKEGLSLIHI